ncbi:MULTISPECIES: helix-turn-helix transcriptional regulator [Stenotrophomonas]|jgi:transcriptional regulator with XRE-family HTH domain|uniref:Helix-turn-helix transcriptional regulator n=1 Tax=Stenotrophomonas aracearum TaxID=3003272 RepID=A0ABY9YCK9_9GAMM|nr:MULTISPECIES: helix-turn-helix transcriptional regulator [unclassified Stenotrophomonas]RRU16125.1 XRE family transcriptional regulator [Stenotrophomonas sp. 278]WNH48501.1 helix-turn-helix transcriptional regulator [Stenotrophomonas sp. A5588]
MDEHELLPKIGSALRARRVALGLSQEAFADKIGMHRAYYGRIERGRTNLTIGTLNRLAGGLKVSLGALFTSVEAESTRDAGLLSGSDGG